MAPLNVADEAVATAALEQIYANYLGSSDGGDSFTEYLLTQASKVQFQPSTRQLILKFDLAFGVTDAPQDQ